MSPLGILSRGEKAEVVEIRSSCGCSHGRDKKQACHTEDLGIRAGKTVEVLNNEGGGPLLIKVDESRIAISRGMAMKIMVRRVQG